jgi:hypothetical protein
MQNSRKFTRGNKVVYRGKTWTVCEGGISSPETKSHLYKIARGAWKQHVAGNCILTTA